MGKRWDTKEVNDFIEQFEHATYNYTEPLSYANESYEKYQNNETYVGKAAEASKTFIGVKQAEFNRYQYELTKEMIKEYTSLDDAFKTMVDPSSDARIDTDVIRKIKTHFRNQYEEFESIAFAIQQRTMEVADRFRKYCGDLEEVYVRDALIHYDEYCCAGGFLESCIKKMEGFDEEASRRLLCSGLKDVITGHIEEMVNTASSLDSIQVHTEDVSKKSLSLVTFGANIANQWRNLYNPTAPNMANITWKKYNTIQKQAGRVKIGAVNDNFITVTDTGKFDANGKPIQSFGGDQGWFMNDPDIGPLLNERGCGVVASINQYLYLTGQTTITKEDYKKLMYDYLDGKDQISEPRQERFAQFRKQAIRGMFEGALPGQMTDYVTTMCEKEGVKVTSHWDYFQDYETDYRNMKNQLEKGTPVVWAVYNIDGVTIPFYDYDEIKGKYTPSKLGGAASHYITATAIYEETDANGDTKRMVEISSWGHKVYVDYDEYVDIVSDDCINQPFSSITITTVN